MSELGPWGLEGQKMEKMGSSAASEQAEGQPLDEGSRGAETGAVDLGLGEDLDALIQDALGAAHAQELAEQQRAMERKAQQKKDAATQQYRQTSGQLARAKAIQSSRMERVRSSRSSSKAEWGGLMESLRGSAPDYGAMAGRNLLTASDQQQLESLDAAIGQLQTVANPDTNLQQKIRGLLERQAKARKALEKAIQEQITQEDAAFSLRRQSVLQRAEAHYQKRVDRLQAILTQLEQEFPDISQRAEELAKAERLNAQAEQQRIEADKLKEHVQAMQIVRDTVNNASDRLHRVLDIWSWEETLYEKLGKNYKPGNYPNLLPHEQDKIKALCTRLVDAVLYGQGDARITHPKEVLPWVGERARRFLDAQKFIEDALPGLRGQLQEAQRQHTARIVAEQQSSSPAQHIAQLAKLRKQSQEEDASEDPALLESRIANLRNLVYDMEIALKRSRLIGRLIGPKWQQGKGGKEQLTPFFAAFETRAAWDKKGIADRMRQQHEVSEQKKKEAAAAERAKAANEQQAKTAAEQSAAVQKGESAQLSQSEQRAHEARINAMASEHRWKMAEEERNKAAIQQREEFTSEHKEEIDAMIAGGGIAIEVDGLPGAVKLRVERGKKGKYRVVVDGLAGPVAANKGVRVGSGTPDANGLSGFPDWLKKPEVKEYVRQLIKQPSTAQ